ncbi:DUF4232 domain-containing protein [Streptomyces sp. BPTC-684]|uniref:DUF4232 domain-containing protein n=1 Tax=Streptomyces sp. BPTC-684 TaxID=3043734 RepID=UPI0024B18067|nr:DUF4232 domain-containing protein [Streptomyces sp. BPTC-684]WHM37313.1 DUF4232 domain-containing protein [Streptomyces sp. BPTC-684]
MRTNLRITAAATTALVAALSLSACGSDSGSKESDKAASKPSVSAPATSSTDGGRLGATTGGDSAGTTGGTGGTSGGTGGSGGSGSATGGQGTAKPAKANGKQSGGQSGSGSGSGSAKRVTCTGSNVKLTATPVSRPINHVLLTATNTGKTTCNAYDAPAVKFSNAQSPIPVDKDTIPQSVVTLAPGQSAYAMIRTQGEPDGTDPYMTSQVVVYFRGAVGMESVGRSAYASLAKPVGVVDAQAMATYWQSDMSAISAW